MLGGIGAGGELAVNRRLGQHSGIGNEGVDGVDAGVEIVFDGVEVAVVGVGNLRRDRPLGDLIDIGGGNVERADHRIQGVVHPLHDLAIVALMLGRVGAGGELAGHRRL